MSLLGVARWLLTWLEANALGIILAALLFSSFWQLTPELFFTGVVHDLHQYASPEARAEFTDTLALFCVNPAEAITEHVPEDKAQGVGMLFELCSNESAYAALEKECDWRKSNPTAVRLPRGEWSFDSIREMDEGCTALWEGKIAGACSNLSEGMEQNPVLGPLQETCDRFDAGELSREQLSRAFLLGTFQGIGGGNLSEGPMRVLSPLLSAMHLLEQSRLLLLAALILLCGTLFLTNLRQPEKAMRAISNRMTTLGLLTLVPYAVIQVYLGIVGSDTSAFFQLAGAGDLGGIARSLLSLLPILLSRTYTGTLVAGAAGMALLGISLRLLARIVQRREQKSTSTASPPKPANPPETATKVTETVSPGLKESPPAEQPAETAPSRPEGESPPKTKKHASRSKGTGPER
ncbi:hypothetical protein J4439_03330 [Candidatus Woesearchaeota archaeon]|nr:hypothetical protein [Candidatus Woesearchaeota archaeon]